MAPRVPDVLGQAAWCAKARSVVVRARGYVARRVANVILEQVGRAPGRTVREGTVAVVPRALVRVALLLAHPIFQLFVGAARRALRSLRIIGRGRRSLAIICIPTAVLVVAQVIALAITEPPFLAAR